MEHISDAKISANVEKAACAHAEEPIEKLESTSCRSPVQMGFFFDGTQNNRDRDKKRYAHSNIARLFEAYPDQTTKGIFKTYIPGVGTPFPEIGDTDESTNGNAFGIGCEARVLFALLTVQNVIHIHSFDGRRFVQSHEILDLCRAPSLFTWDSEEKKGLHNSAGGTAFLSAKARSLQTALESTKNQRTSMCVVDVFGFSRGAAEARVFCSWLANLAKEGKFAGIPIRIRFLGIFDTVASAGFWNAIENPRTTDGHSGWASPQFLRVPDLVENCAHFIAMHELRKNFPLDQIDINGKLRKGHVEVAFPGSHSDVGGGYGVGDLGISVGVTANEGDALKLSQIPLNYMLRCARSAGVPMSTDGVIGGSKISAHFEISPRLSESFQSFLRESGKGAKSMREWMQPYLNWRWQVRNSFSDTKQMTSASPEDRKFMSICNAKLIQDAQWILEQGNVSRSRKYVETVISHRAAAESDRHYRSSESKILHFDTEAPAVLYAAMEAPKVSPALAEFFDSFVHDSYAGFSRSLLEITGYWRYRKIFSGSDKPTF